MRGITLYKNRKQSCFYNHFILFFYHVFLDLFLDFPTLAIPVTFKQKLKNQEAVEEGCVTLRCELSKPGVPVEWRRNAQLLKEGDKYQMKQEGRVSELLIRNLTLTDTAEYSCFVGSVVTSADIKVRGMLYLSQYDSVALTQFTS